MERLGRRVAGLAVMVIVGGLAAPLPHAEAVSPIVRVAAHCAVDRLSVALQAGDCPIDSTNLIGHARADANAAAATGTFAVRSVAQANRLAARGRQALTTLELESGELHSTGGPVKVVITDLAGHSDVACPRLCETVGRAFSDTYFWVTLRMRSGDDGASHQALCPVTLPGEAAPDQLVVPDDCRFTDATLSAPPNSTFTVHLTLAAEADAAAGGTATSTLAGRIAEIRVA
jgi:hypothetical protein